MSLLAATMRRRHGQRGFAIILVLWLLVLLSAIALHLTSTGRSELRIAFNTVSAARAEALADAGVARAVFAAADPDPDRRWLLDGQMHEFTLGGGRIDVALHDENSKINPNIAPGALMAALFRQTGVDRSMAASLAAAITLRIHPPKATAGSSDAERRPTPFDSIDDLQAVSGMTPEIVAMVRPHVSTYASMPVPTVAAADATVLRALAEFQAQVNGGANPTPGETYSDASKATASIIAEARIPGGAVFVRDAVVHLEPTAPKGYVVLHWGRGEPGNS
jgi:general secretion pathway protein K